MTENTTPEPLHDSSTNELEASQETVAPEGMTTQRKVLIAASAMLVSVGLAIGTAWVLEYPMKEHRAESDLQHVFENRSEMVHLSTSVHEYSDATSTTPQQRLGMDGEPLESAQFVFGPEDGGDTEQLDVTVSFGEQRSMDFLRLNANSLQHLVMNNVVTLHLHTAPSAQNPYSILAPEALALAVAEKPDANVWQVMMHLVRLSVQLADEQETDPEILAERIAEVLQHEGFSVSAADIREGVFADWIHNASFHVADDPYGLPIITLEHERISPERVDILNSEAFSNHIWSKTFQK